MTEQAGRIAALVLGAGRGLRMGGAVPKAFAVLRGRTLIERSIDALSAATEVDDVIPVVARGDLALFAALGVAKEQNPKLRAAVAGGAERQDSVAAGLESLPDDVAWIAVHDAARCRVTPSEVSAVIRAALEFGAAILAAPTPDTIKRVREGWIVETPDRSDCWSAQTPQVFRRELLQEGIDKARADGFRATDDAQLVERLGVRVRIVEGQVSNAKITHARDLLAAEALLAQHAKQETLHREGGES